MLTRLGNKYGTWQRGWVQGKYLLYCSCAPSNQPNQPISHIATLLYSLEAYIKGYMYIEGQQRTHHRHTYVCMCRVDRKDGYIYIYLLHVRNNNVCCCTAQFCTTCLCRCTCRVMSCHVVSCHVMSCWQFIRTPAVCIFRVRIRKKNKKKKEKKRENEGTDR